MAVGLGAEQQENGNAPNFYQLLHPLLQHQQPACGAGAWISQQSLLQAITASGG